MGGERAWLRKQMLEGSSKRLQEGWRQEEAERLGRVKGASQGAHEEACLLFSRHLEGSESPAGNLRFRAAWQLVQDRKSQLWPKYVVHTPAPAAAAGRKCRISHPSPVNQKPVRTRAPGDAPPSELETLCPRVRALRRMLSNISIWGLLASRRGKWMAGRDMRSL